MNFIGLFDKEGYRFGGVVAGGFGAHPPAEGSGADGPVGRYFVFDGVIDGKISEKKETAYERYAVFEKSGMIRKKQEKR